MSRPGVLLIIAGLGAHAVAQAAAPSYTQLDRQSNSIAGYYYADQYAGGISKTGIFASTLCATSGCFVIAPPAWTTGTHMADYTLKVPVPFASYIGAARSIFRDDRGGATAVLYRDPVQPTTANGHHAFTQDCLFSTPYEPKGAEYNGSASCFQMSMAGVNSGYSHGNPGFLVGPNLPGMGWSAGNALGMHYTNFTPGIHQAMTLSYYNQAVGDTMGAYFYVQTNGGITAASDEGFKGLTGNTGENPSQYYGTVKTGGAGATVVRTSPTGNSNGSQGDGSYLIDTANATYPAKPSPYSFTKLDPLNGHAPDKITVSGTGAISPSTGIGALKTTLAPDFCVPAGNCTQSITFDVTVASGTFHATTPSADVICFAGGFHEQARVTVAGPVLNGVQSLTALVREPHPAGTWIFQGGSSCQFGSFDANVNNGPGGQGLRNTLRYLFEIFGAPDPSHLYVGGFMYGQLAAMPLGNVSIGNRNTAFNIFPGAEVLDVQDYAAANAATPPLVDGTFTLEPNNVDWKAGTPVEEPHSPIGAYCGICWNLIVNSPQAHNSVGYSLAIGGQGAQGGAYYNTTGFDAMKITNINPPGFYIGEGGLAAPPGGIRLHNGLFSFGLAMDIAPEIQQPVLWVGPPFTGVTDPNYNYLIALAEGNGQSLRWSYSPHDNTMSLGSAGGSVYSLLYVGATFNSSFSACNAAKSGSRFGFGNYGHFCHDETSQTTFVQKLSTAGDASVGADLVVKGGLTSYEQIKTAGLGIPVTVYSAAGTTGTPAIVTLTCGGAACPAGLYRISGYAATRHANSGGTITFILTFNDGIGGASHSVTLASWQAGVADSSSQIGPYLFYIGGSSASQPTLTTSFTGGGAPEWFESAIVERLQ
jgi:hypothetical protein